MCRFIAYIGKNQYSIEDPIYNESNSLVKQSKQAKEGISQVNADGFGIAWYDPQIPEEPRIYRSILPAWNDPNLKQLVKNNLSSCFMGHVRASTVGEISYSNCHPFSYKERVFMHNGTIKGFNAIKHELTKFLTTPFFLTIKGQTDSEYFFALLNQFWNDEVSFLKNIELTLTQAIELIKSMTKKGLSDYIRLNCILTNGKEMAVLRYVYPESRVIIPIYYLKTAKDSYLISSEPLNDQKENWIVIPENNLLTINSEFNVSLQRIK